MSTFTPFALAGACVLLTAACYGGQQPPRPERQRYSISQATSDKAQLHTISFSALAFITGDFGASTFIPPGKVCDYFGFQYMRDIDAAQKGHNPAFLNRVAGNVLMTLNDDQKKLFADLATEQAPQLEDLARKRIPLISAFWKELQGQAPPGSSGLNRESVKRLVGDIFALDGELSMRRAEVMAKVHKSLTTEQRAFFGSMKFGDFGSWPDVDPREKMREQGRGMPKMWNVAYMTYASEFYSWTAGSLEADTYFCPERHGTYFGGFYMKDMPAMGKKDFDISLTVTGDSGLGFLNLLNPDQRAVMTSIPDQQRAALHRIVEVRRAISTELRKLLKGEAVNAALVKSLSREYGELDGEMSWIYATSFAKVNRSLTADQKSGMMKLRNLEGFTSAPYYIYSDARRELPSMEGTDLLFFPPKG